MLIVKLYNVPIPIPSPTHKNSDRICVYKMSATIAWNIALIHNQKRTDRGEIRKIPQNLKIFWQAFMIAYI